MQTQSQTFWLNRIKNTGPYVKLCSLVFVLLLSVETKLIAEEREKTAEQDAAVQSTSIQDAEMQDADQTVSQLSDVQERLVQAKNTLNKAEIAAAKIIQAAELEAQSIRTEAKKAALQSSIEPLKVKNESVAVELQSATVEEIANALMPKGWRVMVDVSDYSIKARRFQFVTTKSRDQALAALANTLGLTYQYFFNLKNDQGVPSPLLVISEN